MQLYELQVTRTTITRSEAARIPKGIIGAVIRIRFSPEWENLKKTVVFRAGDITKDILNVEEFAVIPAECTQELGQLLEVGVYGVDEEGTVAIPTMWAAIGKITEATDPSGDTSTDPTLPVWAQLQSRVAKLEEYGVPQAQIEAAVKTYFAEHPITAEDIGAHPNTWLPTAEEVGARPDTWLPTAEEVGARPDTWMPTAADVGAAPTGFGLGEEGYYSSHVTDLDAITKNGWYYVRDEYSPIGQAGVLRVDSSRHDNLIHQTFYPASGSMQGYILRRYLKVDSFQPWEWVNPPMYSGVEYRTTERFSGKPVYAKMITSTASATTTTTAVLDIPHGIEDFGQVVRCTARIGACVLPIIEQTGNISVYWVNATNVRMKLNNYSHKKSLGIDIRYVKA